MLAVISLPAIAGAAGSGAPMPLRGVPLGNGSGLRLVVADNPPFVLDVDSGRVKPIPGIPALNRGIHSVVGIGGRAAVVVAPSTWPDANLYGVRGPGARVSQLGIGRIVRPAADGRGVWVFRSHGRSRCKLRQVGLDGRAIHPARAFPCTTVSDPPGGSLGLVVHRTRVLDPLSGRSVFKAPWGVVAIAGTSAVLAGPEDGLTLVDAKTGARRTLRPATGIGGEGGLDAPAVDPAGRFIALAFANPSWGGSSAQVQDVWVVDANTGTMTQLPGMPAFVRLKFTSMAWTHEGRLVLLGEQLGGRDFVAVWRPGWRRLAVKRMSLPEREGGSDSFAPIR